MDELVAYVPTVVGGAMILIGALMTAEMPNALRR